MGIVRQLDEILANKIAAGEVVERCCSVVKELVENSIDAKSTEVRVELLESGVKSIKVIDNGKGMDSDDAVNCFNRHATSKIYDEDDLYHISTLGFRGEALASIASVSKVKLITSQGNVGTIVVIEGGKMKSVESSDARVGTIMEVRDLFYNTPARLKHLKSLYTELANITEYMNKLALSRPDIRFTLINDDKVVLKTDGSNNLLKVINSIYGLSITKKMVPIEGETNDYSITGYTSLPEIHRANRNGIVTIVNNRIVKNVELNRYINEAYHSYKPDNRYPVTVIDIKVDTSLVDVNIHPTKMDVKFSKQDSLNELVFNAIREKISGKTLIPHIENVEPKVKVEEQVLDFDTNKIEKKEEIKEQFKLDFDKPIDGGEDLVINNDLVKESEEEYIVHEDIKERIPVMWPIGQVHGTYIICQNEQGMYIIDQHAAKERVNYEIVREKMSQRKNESMQMLVPLTLEFSNNEFMILKENMEMLTDMGFDIEEFGVSSIIVKAHPVWLQSSIWVHRGDIEDVIKEMLEMVIKREKKFDLNRFYDHISATVACKMSIKANTSITLEEMQSLIDELRECKNPYNCPHGRPTIVFYTKVDLEKMFKRTGF